VAIEDVGVELLVEAGVALAESLDLERTLGRVAKLTVPRLADLCVIDMLAEDGSIRQMAVASADREIARKLESLRERQQLDPAGEHPVARVIRSGVAELLAQMTGAQLHSFAEGAEHAQFMLDNGYNAAVVAPLLARQRTLGTLSVLRLGGEESYSQTDMELVCELARRAALAIDNARLFSDARRVEQRLQAILVNLAEAITLTDGQDRIVFANRAAAELLGASTAEDLVDVRQGDFMRRYLLTDERGHELSVEDMPRSRLFAGEAAEPLLFKRVDRETGEELWLMTRPAAISDPESGEMLFALNVYENITEVKRTQLMESFMAEASRVLASSTDFRDTLQHVARLAVAQIADWCAIDVLGEDDEIERVAIHHADPTKLALAEQLDRSYQLTPEKPIGVPEVIRSGRARILTSVPDDVLAAVAHDEKHLRLLREIEATAVIIAPLAAPTRTVGAITLASSTASRRLTQADLGLAERLGRRAGTAVESARLYTERTRIANTLQAALLPESLPAIPSIEIEALYRAAGELNDVGGDFYDVIPYGEQRWLLSIGDVCGKGPRAASVTALARHTLRTAARLGQTPAGMLQTLHESLREQPAGADLCTVCLIVLEPGARHARLTVALAGHPPPLLIAADGRPTQLGRPGTLLGVLDPIDINEVQAELHTGETLLLYTDGLPEAGLSGAQLGEQGLLELSAEAPRLALDVLLARIEQAALTCADGRLRDDIALMAVRLSDEETR
jgi:PAS domain S-box-containing protein